MGCKNDDTCDQPSTKGEIQTVMWYGGIGLLTLLGFVTMIGYKLDKAEITNYSNTLRILTGMGHLKEGM